MWPLVDLIMSENQYDTLNITHKDNYAIVQISRGRGNAINHGMIKDIRHAFAALKVNSKVSGVILTGNPGFFSVGLDVIELYDYDEEKLTAFWADFHQMVVDLTSFPKPLFAAISGFSPAGGCVMAVCCDYRLMAEGEKFQIGLNEVAVGIRVPAYIFHLYSFWIGSRKAYQNLMQGRLLSVAEAFESGLVDEVCSMENLLARAEEVMKHWLKHADSVVQSSKMNMRKELIEKVGHEPAEDIKARLAQWFHPESRKVMGALVAKLKAKAV